MSVGQPEGAVFTVDLLGLRRRVGAVLLRIIGDGSLCGALRREDSWNPLSMRFIVSIHERAVTAVDGDVEVKGCRVVGTESVIW